MSEQDPGGEGIAVIGLAGRFPKAPNVDELWSKLRAGASCLTPLSDEELLENGVDPQALELDSYVKVASILDDIESFDANHFGFSPAEVLILDPQQRLFLECAAMTLENAGYNPDTYPGDIGIFGSVSVSGYLLNNLYSSRDLAAKGRNGMHLRMIQVMMGNDKDYLTTRVSHRLNLRGPSATVQTACSSSLVAVHLACQSIENGEADMALAGGVSIKVPHRVGYYYEEGAIVSADGCCRAFDARANGTVFGSGVGLVLLKSLDQALEDGDSIRAVIRGTAINNDGS